MKKTIKGYKNYLTDGKVVYNSKGKELGVTKATGKYQMTNDKGARKGLTLEEINALTVDAPKEAAAKPAKDKKVKVAKEKKVTKVSTILELMDKGLDEAAIAKKTGYSMGKINRTIKGYSIKMLYAAGKTANQIAKELERPVEKIQAFLDRHYGK